jgi:hypothetical protein
LLYTFMPGGSGSMRRIFIVLLAAVPRTPIRAQN